MCIIEGRLCRMIQREMYMKRIRPFIGTDLVKVMTGIRRCGKSVMLNLIKDELKASGVQDVQMISFNFEVMSNAHLCTAQALHDEVLKQAAAIEGKVYLFFDEIQEVAQWEKAINSFRIELDCDIYITGSNAKLLSGDWRPCWAGAMWNLPFTPSLLLNFSNSTERLNPVHQTRQLFSST